MNVFKGKTALQDFYNPEKNPPLPVCAVIRYIHCLLNIEKLVEIPDHPFVDDGVEIYAKMLSLVPAANVKLFPGQKFPIQVFYYSLFIQRHSSQHACACEGVWRDQ
jgi:hypothetical protein